MNDATKTRRTDESQLPEPVVQALNTILASVRAWHQFQEHASDLRRENQRQNDSEQSMFEDETATRVWLDTVESAEIAGVLSPPRIFLLRVSAIERIHDRRVHEGLYAELDVIVEKLDAIRQREGLNDDQFWRIGQGPEDWEDLDHQYEEVLEARFEEALREFGFDNIADLYHTDRKSYDALREKGRRLVFEGIPELERLSTVQRQFETEAGICAKGGAYHAAAVMLGSAIEAALLFTCLNRRDEAGNARSRLPDDKRPKRANPKQWSLHQLAMVAEKAGWLPGFNVGPETLYSPPLLDMMRNFRNLVHPKCHLSNKRIADVEREYDNAQAAYNLLKWHLATLRVSSDGE